MKLKKIMKNILAPWEISLIHSKCSKYQIKEYTINNDGTIDVQGNVNLRQKQLSKLPFKFNIVNGSFNIASNQLVSLINCPKKVTGDFFCSDNHLTSLEYCPDEIGGAFNCSVNRLTSLEHCPRIIHKTFSCSENRLTSLEYGPVKVGGYYTCSYNKLTTIKGCPEKVGVNFVADHTLLEDLIDFNTNVSGMIMIHDSQIPDILKEFLVNYNENQEKNEQIKVFLKFHKYYDVWGPEFNHDNCALLINDIKEGLR